jgi:hypothetical protein
MGRRALNFGESNWTGYQKLAVAAIFLTTCFSACSIAPQPGQKLFLSPEAATSALVTAVQNNDEKAMLEVLGREGKQIVSSGDETEDANSRANFVQKYRRIGRNEISTINARQYYPPVALQPFPNWKLGLYSFMALARTPVFLPRSFR